MQRSVFKRSGRVVITILRWLLVVCLLAATVSALSNLGLPTRSQLVDRLSGAEKARLAEMVHLRQTLGDTVWPGWGEANIPVIVYNEAYAFLIGYPNPPPGWLKMPQRIARGKAWEPVPDDTFAGQPYFRQHLADPTVTPESFTVLIGDRWVATFATKEYAQIDFVRGLRAELPPVVRSDFPYRLAWRWLLGESEAYSGSRCPGPPLPRATRRTSCAIRARSGAGGLRAPARVVGGVGEVCGAGARPGGGDDSRLSARAGHRQRPGFSALHNPRALLIAATGRGSAATAC